MEKNFACPKCKEKLSYMPDKINPCCEHCGEMILGITKEFDNHTHNGNGKYKRKNKGTVKYLICPECEKYYGIPESGYNPKYCRICPGVELKLAVEEFQYT